MNPSLGRAARPQPGWPAGGNSAPLRPLRPSPAAGTVPSTQKCHTVQHRQPHSNGGTAENREHLLQEPYHRDGQEVLLLPV